MATVGQVRKGSPITASINLRAKDQARAPEPAVADIPELPDYLVNAHTWAYVAPTSVDLLDRESVVATILWCQQNKLMRAARAEIAPGDRVLQPVAVYGRPCTHLAARIGPHGEYHVTDIQQIQIDHVARKTRGMPQVHTGLSDAR